MASPDQPVPPFYYLILLMGNGKPLFFGPYTETDVLVAEARKQRRLFPAAKLLKLVFRGPKNIESEPLKELPP